MKRAHISMVFTMEKVISEQFPTLEPSLTNKIQSLLMVLRAP